jgi:Ca-activated chloride channel family protein
VGEGKRIMNQSPVRPLLLLVLLLALPALGCGLTDGSLDEGGAPRNAAVAEVMGSTSVAAWMATAVPAFNAAELETSDGRPAYVTYTAVESGQAVADWTEGAPLPDLWIPEESVWPALAADQGLNLAADCRSTAESPLVIGMWRPMAESLGWPGLPLGWLDIGSLAADPSAWAYYSGGEYGDALRLSHGHPGLSGSGASTLLALVQAAQGKTDAVTAVDIDQPIVQASVGAFESAVSSFNTSTDALGRTMRERGPAYLGAAVMYESTVVQHGGGEIVAIYPLEGTFMATHPACIDETAAASAQETARLFRDYLLSEEGQQLALAVGLRPVNVAVPVGAPIDEAHGADPSQPQIVFDPPTVDAVYAVQDLWQAARKPVNLVMLLDTSGSMRGAKIEGMKEAAVQFVQQMGDEDTITLIEFYGLVDLLIQQAPVGTEREQVIAAIEAMEAGGDTMLFDAIGDAGALIGTIGSPEASNAMIVLTDGQDTASSRYTFGERLLEQAAANDTTVFSIAYGSDADENLLAELATRGNGNFYRGDEASIAAIYEEMSAAFGGSLGVGR